MAFRILPHGPGKPVHGPRQPEGPLEVARQRAAAEPRIPLRVQVRAEELKRQGVPHGMALARAHGEDRERRAIGATQTGPRGGQYRVVNGRKVYDR
jgi:hypothetical protein